MLTNFIYAQSKAMFEERFAEVPNDAIVFIEDTKEIWTHGTYFDCSTLDPNIIPNLQMEIDELKSKVVTPDWDAQVGEAGYIANKPFGFSNFIRLKDLNPKYYYDEDDNEICEAIIPLVDSFDVYTTIYRITDSDDVIGDDYFKTKEDIDFDYGIPNYNSSVKYSLEPIHTDEYLEGFKIKFKAGTIESHSDLEYCVFIVDTYYGKVATISENFIPDSIARKNEFTTINGQSIIGSGDIDLVADGDEVSNLTLKPGCKIGSFSVDSDNNLSSHDEQHVVISNDGISISSDDYTSVTTIKNFGLQVTSEHENMPAMSIIGPNGIEIADPLRNQTVGYAIRALDGMFAGLRPWVRVIDSSSSSSDKTLTTLDHTILIYSSSAQTITLPTDPKDGQEYTIMMSLSDPTSVKHTISSGSTNIFYPKDGAHKSSLSVDAHGCVKLIYVKDTGLWWYYRIA